MGNQCIQSPGSASARLRCSGPRPLSAMKSRIDTNIFRKRSLVNIKRVGILAATLCLASCGALQRGEVRKTAQAVRIGHVCNVDISVILPQSHHPATFIFGSRETEYVFRIQFPAGRGRYSPPDVSSLSYAPESQPDGTKTGRWQSLGWNYGTINFTGDRLDVELFDSPSNGSQPFAYNGTYNVEPAGACNVP